MFLILRLAIPPLITLELIARPSCRLTLDTSSSKVSLICAAKTSLLMEGAFFSIFYFTTPCKALLVCFGLLTLKFLV